MKLTLTLTLASTCLVFALLLEQVLREPGVARPHSTLPALQTLVETGPMQLRVLTLNTWGLWLVSRRRADRMAALAAFLRRCACKQGCSAALAPC